MGKTSKPTRILVHPSLIDVGLIRDLQAQGHEVEEMGEFAVAWDLILGPNAWHMTPELLPYLLSHALPAARKAADERKKKGQ